MKRENGVCELVFYRKPKRELKKEKNRIASKIYPLKHTGSGGFIFRARGRRGLSAVRYLIKV